MIYIYNTDTKQYVTMLGSVDLLDVYKEYHPDIQVSYTLTALPGNYEYAECYYYDETNNVWNLNEDDYSEYLKTILLNKIQKVADNLTENAPYLLMPGVSKEQVDRYKLKYYKAKDNDTAFFECEASITGIAVDDLINIVLQNGQPIEEAYNNLISNIEGFRRGCKLLTYGKKFDAANLGVKFMKALKTNINLTQEQFLSYVSGEVTTIGDVDSNSTIKSVIDIIGYVPEETD